MIPKTLAILAGGKSSRMNYHNKALLLYQNKKFVEHIIEAGCDFEEIIIITNTPSHYQEFNLETFPDIFPGNGPLSGIHAALKVSKTDQVLCIACDMPRTKQEVLNYLGEYVTSADVLVPQCGDRIQPMCAVYHKRLVPKLESYLINHDLKLQKFILSVNYEVISQMNHRMFEEKDFLNINTPSDLLELEEM